MSVSPVILRIYGVFRPLAEPTITPVIPRQQECPSALGEKLGDQGGLPEDHFNVCIDRGAPTVLGNHPIGIVPNVAPMKPDQQRQGLVGSFFCRRPHHVEEGQLPIVGHVLPIHHAVGSQLVAPLLVVIRPQILELNAIHHRRRRVHRVPRLLGVTPGFHHGIGVRVRRAILGDRRAAGQASKTKEDCSQWSQLHGCPSVFVADHSRCTRKTCRVPT